jgi:hypothetical protein
MKIDSEQLKHAIKSRILDLTLKEEENRKLGIFESEYRVRREELEVVVLFSIAMLEKLEEGDIEGINQVKQSLEESLSNE